MCEKAGRGRRWEATFGFRGCCSSSVLPRSFPAAPVMILILYTTRYREGGEKFARAARTLADDKRRQHPGATVRPVAVESKAEVVAQLRAAREEGTPITELHFIGHSGMYGPMFRTRAIP